MKYKKIDILNCFQEFYEIQKKIIEENHIDILYIKNDINIIFYRKNKWSFKIFKEIYNKFQISVPNHYCTFGAKNNIASIFTIQA